jgi:hypothetical protein
MATMKTVPLVPWRRSMTGVEVMPISGSLAVGERGVLPELGAVVRVERIDAVVLCYDVEDVVGLVLNDDGREVERLSVDFAVDGKKIQLAEGRGIHVRRREDGLVGVEACARVVVVVGDGVVASGRCDGKSECCGVRERA